MRALFKTPFVRRAAGALILAVIASVPFVGSVSAAASEAPCTFSQNFKALHDAIPDVVGDCLGNETPWGPSSTRQFTSRGTLTWISQSDPYLRITFFTPDNTNRLQYTLGSPDDCRNGVYLPTGICLTVDTQVPIPQSILDAGYTAKAICEKNGNVLIGDSSCFIRYPNGRG
jgi:hypothetical protein